MLPLAAAPIVFGLMLIEALVAAKHDRELRQRGAIEPAGDVYRAMQAAYPGAFLAMIIEGGIRGAGPGPTAMAGLAVFLTAKTLKYWAIHSLGARWTFRVLVPPGSRRIVTGPYRWLDHPNYVAVALELIGVALAMRALVSGPIGTLGFIWLMHRRVRIEETALARQ